jgi:uncharacterized membrane protein
MNRMRTYLVSAGVMLTLDLVWLGLVSPPLYRSTIGPLMRSSPDLVAAALFYAIYLIGVNEFVIRAVPRGTPLAKVAARGALFGLVAYATFDLTAQAVLAGWSPLVTAVDMAWGTLLTATVAAVTHAAAGRRAA